jgi:hypothetical protein
MINIYKSNIIDNGLEELNKEYKEFYLDKIEFYFNEEICKKIIYDKHRIDHNIFNRMIDENIRDYMIKYIPKYLNSYSSAGLSGELYFGIGDDGKCHGIPYYGHIDKKIILDGLDSVRNILRGLILNNVNNDIIRWYYDNIKIDIIEIEHNTNEDDNIIRIGEILKNNQILEIEWNKYLKKRQEWHQEILKYSIGLSKYLESENMRYEISEYINMHLLDNKYDKKILENLSNMYIKNEYNEREISIDLVESIRNNWQHPLKWVLDYKNYKINDLKFKKPLRPQYKPIEQIYTTICKDIKNIKFQLANNGCKLYLIKMKIPYLEGTRIEYYSPKKKTWINRKRIYIKSGPSCY